MRSDKRFKTSVLYALICGGVLTLGSAGIAFAANHEGDSASGDSSMSSQGESTGNVKNKPSNGDVGMTKDGMSADDSSMAEDSMSSDAENADNVKNKPSMSDEGMTKDNMSSEGESSMEKKDNGY